MSPLSITKANRQCDAHYQIACHRAEALNSASHVKTTSDSQPQGVLYNDTKVKFRASLAKVVSANWVRTCCWTECTS